VATLSIAGLVDTLEAQRTAVLSEAVSAVQAEAVRICRGLSDEQLSWRPEPHRWSIAENLAHVRITTEVFLPAVDATLATLRERNLLSRGSSNLGLYGRALVWSMEGRPVIRMRAPKAIQPSVLGAPAVELEQFLSSQTDIQQRIADAQGLDLTAFRFPSPLVRCLRVNLLEFFSTFNAHSRRHLKQAGKIRQQIL
jgi:hypothetical protein